MSDDGELAAGLAPRYGERIEINGVVHIDSVPAFVKTQEVEDLVDRGWMSRRYADNLFALYPDEAAYMAAQEESVK